MMESIENYWQGLSSREKKLVALAVLLAGALLIWLLLRPAMAIGTDLARAHQTAVEREGRVMAKAAMLRRPATKMGGALSGAAAEQYLAQSASEIGMALSRNERRGERHFSIGIASGKAQAVVGWIAGLEEAGFVVDALTITPQADGSIGMTADLHRGAP
ncbi:MAG TPA: type II secretion system protein GspM [Sphingopyxis sp.]|nr:type II secretion system protein GspM [Sphingopyxis sp.]